jgi:DNA ligase D-like protein (predicted ligase)
MSRNRKQINTSYPEVVRALSSHSGYSFIADGEIVAFDGAVTSFAKLQNRMHLKDPDEAENSGITVYMYLFDLLHADGFGLTSLSLRARKSLLRRLLPYEDPLRFMTHRNEKGEAYYREACDRGWEGLIAKDATSSDVHSRSKKWLKFKCVNQQELVIGGYTPPEGERVGFGALLLGYYAGEDLRYAGKVGTGFSRDLLRDLKDKLDSHKRRTSPFAGEVDERDVTWVSPKLVAEIGFTEWTGDGKLRHPRFLGLRRDKAPRDVTREAG